jgi:hypothetical protein
MANFWCIAKPAFRFERRTVAKYLANLRNGVRMAVEQHLQIRILFFARRLASLIYFVSAGGQVGSAR